MGFVQREIGNVFVRSDNFQILPTKRGKELYDIGQAIKRKGIIIIIFPEYDFEMFYKKHCEKMPNDNREFTVLVEEKIKIPEKDKVKKLIENALLDKNAKLKDDLSIVIEIDKGAFIKKYKVRKFFDNNFLEETKDGSFRFRDIEINLTNKHLEELFKRKIISEREYNSIKNIRNSAFTSECNYTINDIWLISHTDII